MQSIDAPNPKAAGTRKLRAPGIDAPSSVRTGGCPRTRSVSAEWRRASPPHVCEPTRQSLRKRCYRREVTACRGEAGGGHQGTSRSSICSARFCCLGTARRGGSRTSSVRCRQMTRRVFAEDFDDVLRADADQRRAVRPRHLHRPVATARGGADPGTHSRRAAWASGLWRRSGRRVTWRRSSSWPVSYRALRAWRTSCGALALQGSGEERRQRCKRS